MNGMHCCVINCSAVCFTPVHCCSTSTRMSLLCYFKTSSDTAKLPGLCSPLSMTMPSSSIESANAEVKRVIEVNRVIESERNACRGKGGHCEKFSPKLRLGIEKCTAVNRVAAMITVHSYAKRLALKESSVRTWKNTYTWEIQPRQGGIFYSSEKFTREDLEERPSLSLRQSAWQARAYITAILNTVMSMSCAEGIIRSHDSNFVASDGVYVLLTKDREINILRHMVLSSAELAPRRKCQ